MLNHVHIYIFCIIFTLCMFQIFWINLIDVLCILCSIFISLIIAGQVAAAEGSSAEEPRKHARFHASCFTTFPEVGVWSVRSCTLGRELKIGDRIQLRFPLFSGMWVDSNGTFRGRECLSGSRWLKDLSLSIEMVWIAMHFPDSWWWDNF